MRRRGRSYGIRLIPDTIVLKENAMKARVTEDCIACGRCVDICPEVFEMGESIAQVKVDPIPEEFEGTTRDAADECPVSAIVVER
jgi:ferredoxin